MIRLRFDNSNDAIIYIQIDPFAGLYALKKGESIEIEADGTISRPTIEFDEYNDTRIVTLVDYEEYYVIRNGQRIHWTKYTTNISE